MPQSSWSGLVLREVLALGCKNVQDGKDSTAALHGQELRAGVAD